MVLWGWVSCFDCFLSWKGGANGIDWLDLPLDLMILNVGELVLDVLLYVCNAWICVDRCCTSLAWFHCLICLIYPISVISNATHFICAMIWVCWLSFLDSSSFSYPIHVIGFLCGSIHSVSSIPWLWWLIVIASFIWLFDVAACILWYPDFTPCCNVVPFWSYADSVVVSVYVPACGLLDDVLYVAVLEVHAVSLINSWCAWRAWAKLIGLLGVNANCVVVVRSACMSY